MAICFCILMIQSKCHTEYKNAPEICAILIADDQSLLQRDVDALNNGEITQEQFELRKRNRENGTLGLCLISLIKREQSGNF
ncbi:hypothetical protein [Leptospira kanakyensis]|uniref:hypothetical protein n=1 Tax=Leptospira kanakyensis TaxID=2484968 RepID=UPI00223D4FC4|nr:hypothetical protein [Leptospira kanakyensis]MCW7483294.1 hypothetical protein [Leptospira kanakyensis]